MNFGQMGCAAVGWMRMLPETPQSVAALEIARTLRRHGHQAYFAGGCVRDLVLGCAPKDYDVATSARPELVLDMFPRAFAVGAKFGVVLVAMECAGTSVLTEVATFRADGSYSDGRRPDAVCYTLSAEEDVLRRDFTINGLLLDPERALESGDIRGAVLDFVDGLKDIQTGLIRAIGAPHSRFEEDHLRLLRGVRFAARINFVIEDLTRSAMAAMAHTLDQVSRERVRDELTRMLTEGRARHAFEALAETSMLAVVLPEIERMRGVEQPPEFHPEGDVWEHTLRLLDQLAAGCSKTLAWGALLHDAGKPATFQRAPDRIRFDGHVEVGARIAEEICRRLRFSNEESAQIASLVANHMRFGDVERMKASTLKRFFQLPHFEEHLALHRLDSMAASGRLKHWQFAKDRWETMPAEEVRPVPLVTGRELIAAGYRPGPRFKQILHAVEDTQLEGAITTADEAMALVRRLFPIDEVNGD